MMKITLPNFLEKIITRINQKRNHMEHLYYLHENSKQISKVMQSSFVIEPDERISNVVLHTINVQCQSKMNFLELGKLDQETNTSNLVRVNAFTNANFGSSPSPAGGLHNAYANIGSNIGIMGGDTILAPYYIYMTYWTTFYQTSSLAKRLINVLTEAMVSRWISLIGDDEESGDEKVKLFEDDYLKKYKVKRFITRATRQMFMHGGCALYIDTVDPDLTAELDDDMLQGTFLGFKFVDQGLLVPVNFKNTFNFEGPNFNTPDMWQIVYPNGRKSTQIHRSRFIFFIPEELPFDAKINQLWWGNSLFVSVHDDINNAERAFKSSGQLITQASLRFLKTDMRNKTRVPGAVSAGQTLDVKNRLFQKAVTSNGNAILLDKEDDIAKLEVGNLKGQAEMIIALVNKICASDGVPLTIYWGNPQTGFSSGDAEIIHFQGTIQFKQECYLDDPMQRVIRIGNIVCFNKENVVKFNFNPIYESTESQKADVTLKNSQRRALDLQNGVPVEVVLQEVAREGIYPDLQYKDCAKYAKDFESKQLELAQAGKSNKPGFEDKDIKDDKSANTKPTNKLKSNQPENVTQRATSK